MRRPYRRRQVGWSTHGVSLVVGLSLAGFFGSRGLTLAAIFIAVLTLAIALLFGWLTVGVDDESVTAVFGVGVIRRRLPLAALESCRPVRNKWYYGWGIRLIPGGTLWNVSGLDAVELTPRGARPFRIGTADPAGLAAAIGERLSAPTRS